MTDDIGRAKALLKAKEIVEEVIALRKRWGRHAGFGAYSSQDVLDALHTIGEAGLLEHKLGENLKEAITAANRAKGAAEARAKNYKNQLDHANEQIRALTYALEDAENDKLTLREQLAESLDSCGNNCRD